MSTDEYADLLNLPHHQSEIHPHMLLHDRAAQFSSFAALTGYEDLIEEAARYTDRREELDEDEKLEIGRKIDALRIFLREGVRIRIVYFQKDSQKEGGYYWEQIAGVSEIHPQERWLLLDNGRKIDFEDVFDLSFPGDTD